MTDNPLSASPAEDAGPRLMADLRRDLEDAAGYLRLTTGTDAKMWNREDEPTIRALADRLAAFARCNTLIRELL